MRRTHHNAFEHGLAADKRLLAALQRGQKLNSHEKSPQGSQKSHGSWMIFPATEHQQLEYHRPS